MPFDIFLFANNAVATISMSITSTDVEVIVAPGEGVLFPAPSDNFVFTATLSNKSGTLLEIIKVTTRSGDIMTVERAQEGTIAQVWPIGTLFQQLVTQKQLESFVQWNNLGVPYKTMDLGSGGGSTTLNLDTLPLGAPLVMIALTAGAPIMLSDITGAVLGLSVILTVLEGSSNVSIPLGAPPFYLSDISGDAGWPGFPFSVITLLYNPLNVTYKWVEQARTWRIS